MSDTYDTWEQVAADYRAGLAEEAHELSLGCASERHAERARELRQAIIEGEMDIDAASLELALLEDEITTASWVIQWGDLTFKEGAD